MKRFIIVGLLLLAAAAGGIAAALAQDAAAYQGRIYPGVSIAGVDVSGMTRPQAAAAAQPVADAQLSRTMTLRVDTEQIPFTHAQLGLVAHTGEAVAGAYALGHDGSLWSRLLTRLRLARQPVDVPIRYSWNGGAALTALAPLARSLEATPQDAQVTVQDGRVVITRHSRNGRVLDETATAARIRAALDAGLQEVDAAVQVTLPRFSSSAAADLRVPVASYSTRIGGTENRLHNIALAAGFIRGTILTPGDFFSYNQTVGPRTVARGFKEAPVLIDDELVPGDGGGICQVSSTLFNVALLSDVQILSRNNHSRPVAYLPIGRDATVSFGTLDLAFKNTTGHYLLLWTRVVGRRITITAFSTPAPDKRVSIFVSEREVIPAPEHTVTKRDPELEEGKVVTREPLPGYRVRTYRVVTLDGGEVRRELIGVSYYRPVARTIKIGIKKVKPEELGS